MKKQTFIKLKAAFLLTVFTLNSVIGFACSIGVDMGYNSKHHPENEEIEAVVHIHKDGKRHIHYEKKEQHNHEKKHAKAGDDNKKGSSSGNCCTNKIKSFGDLDKSRPNGLNIAHPLFAVAFLAVFYKVNLPFQSEIVKDIKQFVRSYHPPIPDIRIAIQSFQI